MAVQFFVFGLLLAWFTGTGKLKALVDALRNEPSSGGSGASTAPDSATPTGLAGVVGLAETQVGKAYRFGAASDTSLKTAFYDCSSLVQSVFGNAGIQLPRTSQQQAAVATPVSNPQPGDLAFGSFSSPNDHVGIYVGNGQVVSALDEAHGVVTTAVNKWPGLHFGRVQQV